MSKRERVVAVVQARMGAKRLPGKVLADVVGRPILWHVVDRVRRARRVDEVVVATTTEPADDPVARLCQACDVPCFRGSESDVLDRFYQCARAHGADLIVRITSDCPLADPAVIDRVIERHLEERPDYTTNTLRYTYPDGLDVEVFSFAALERIWREATEPADREHLARYVRVSGRFATRNVESDVDLSGRNLRWTLDEPSDLEFVRRVYSRLYDARRPFGLRDVLDLLEKEPALLKLNEGIIRDEWYYKSIAAEPPVPTRHRSLQRSYELKAKAAELIPAYTQTFSKGPTQFVQGVAPVFLARGQGSHVWDVDGNEYVDYPMGLGPVILGHNYPAVSEAATAQIREGIAFSLATPLEVEVAELLTEVIPSAEMVRFGKNGSDATSGAVRAARAFTGREVIACCGYHGWQDWYIGTTTRNRGVPKAVQGLTVPFAYNDPASLERVFAQHSGKVAAVIMEPIGVVEPADGFLEAVRDLTHREGALLVFDEIITGFRLAPGGAQEYFGVTPDLTCVGKAMGNGFPISAIAGRREIMRLFDEIFFSFTFGGEAASLAAAKATIHELRSRDVVRRIWEQGQRLKDGYNAFARLYGLERQTQSVGLAPRTVQTFKAEDGSDDLILKSLFQQECLKRGVLFAASQLPSFSHTDEDVEHTLRVYRTAMEILAEAVKSGTARERLEGPPVEAVFRRA